MIQMLSHLRVGEKEPLSIMRGLVGGLGPLQQIFNKYFKQDNKYLLEVSCWAKDEQQSQKSSLICFMKWEIWPSANDTSDTSKRSVQRLLLFLSIKKGSFCVNVYCNRLKRALAAV